MCHPLRIGARAGCVALCLLLTSCHHPKAWQPVPNAPAIDPKEDFTLTWDNQKQDANGLPLNPYWGLEKTQHEIPPREQPQHPYPCEFDPFSAACTENKDLVLDGPELPNSLICTVGNLQSKLHGHADWLVATQHGCVNWEDQSFDGDYNFRLFPADELRSVITKNNSHFIGLEFDSSETIASVQSQFWQDLRTEVAKENNDTSSHAAQIAAILNPNHPEQNPRAAVVGLFGLDCEHGCKSEIHPVLALAIETNADPNDNTWHLFVRNWGDEGFCSHYRHLVNFPDNQVNILLFDDASSQGLQVIPGTTRVFVTGGVQVPFPTVSFWQNRGPVVSVTLPAPEKTRALVELELHLKWNQMAAPVCTPPPPALAAFRAPEEPNAAEDYLEKARRNAPPGAAHMEALPAAPVPKLIEVPAPATITVGSFTPPSKAAQPAKRVTLASDKARAARNVQQIMKLCSAYGNKLPPFQGQDISAEVCNSAKLQEELKKTK
jgi:hypothetical protein